MIVTIYGPETWSGELVASVTWAHPASREYGTAEINIPRSSDLLALDDTGEARYIHQDGGFFIEIVDYDLGYWAGIADVPTINKEGVKIEAMHIATLTSIRRVAASMHFEAVPAGFIIERGFSHAFGRVGNAAIGKGTFDLSGPLVLGYEFSGQYLSDVLADMMSWTGMEWWLDEQGKFNWGSSGNYYPFPLTDDGDVVDGERSGALTDMAVEITARNSLGMELTIINMDDAAGALYPRQATFGSDQ